jgi:hypothetical protein
MMGGRDAMLLRPGLLLLTAGRREEDEARDADEGVARRGRLHACELLLLLLLLLTDGRRTSCCRLSSALMCWRE